MKIGLKKLLTINSVTRKQCSSLKVLPFNVTINTKYRTIFSLTILQSLVSVSTIILNQFLYILNKEINNKIDTFMIIPATCLFLHGTLHIFGSNLKKK